MELNEYKEQFSQMRHTLREDIKNILAEHGLTSINFDDIDTALSNNKPCESYEDMSDVVKDFAKFRNENTIYVYAEEGQSVECYIDEISFNHGVHFNVTECYFGEPMKTQTAYELMDLFYLYSTLVGFFKAYNYDDTTKIITLK